MRLYWMMGAQATVYKRIPDVAFKATVRLDKVLKQMRQCAFQELQQVATPTEQELAAILSNAVQHSDI